MSVTYRNKQKRSKGVGGFLQIPGKFFNMESDSAKNMTNDILQGNSLIEEPKEVSTNNEKKNKRKPTPIKSSTKRPKVDMSIFNQGKFLNSFYKKK